MPHFSTVKKDGFKIQYITQTAMNTDRGCIVVWIHGFCYALILYKMTYLTGLRFGHACFLLTSRTLVCA